MADTLASLKIAIESGDIKRAQDELNKLGNAAGKTEGETKKLSSSFTSLGTILTAGAIITATKQFVQMADTMTGVQNKLRLVTKSSEELATVQNELFKIAQKTRQGFAETADTYSNFAIAMGNMGKSQKEVLRTVETINKAIAISGGTTQMAAAATMQLGQAFASGTLRGDELNSILENSKGLAQAIADGMGVPIGQLRTLGSEGKITAEILAAALEKSAKSVDEKFGKVKISASDSMTLVANSFLKMVGEVDTQINGSDGFASIMQDMSSSMDKHSGLVSKMAGNMANELEIRFSAVGNIIGLTSASILFSATTLIEDAVNGWYNAFNWAEYAFNRLKGMSDKEAKGKSSLELIDLGSKKYNEMMSGYISEMEKNAKRYENFSTNITKLSSGADLDKKGNGAKGGATAETEKQRKARLKALEEEAKIQRGYLESYAELQANQALENYNNELTYLNAYADLEAQKAIEQYNMELGQLQDLADKQAGYAIDLYNAITPDSQKIIEKYTDIFETMKDMSVETLASFAEQMNQELDKIKIDTFKIEFDTEGLEGLPKAISSVGKAMSNLDKEEKKYQENKIKYQKGTDEYNQNEAEHTTAQIKGYSNLAGAMSNMFKEGSKEAQAMQAVQAGLAMVEATLAVVHAGTSGDVYTAIPRMIATAAMVGTALSNINKDFNGGSASTIASIPNSGTVLGDASAVSESSLNIVNLLSDIHASEYKELRGINRAVTSMSKAIEATVTNIFRTEGGFKASDFASFTPTKLSALSAGAFKKYDDYINKVMEAPGLTRDVGIMMKLANPIGNLINTFSDKIFGGGTTTALISNKLIAGGGTAGGYIKGKNAPASYQGLSYSETDGGWLGSDSSSFGIMNQQASKEVSSSITAIYKSLSETLLAVEEGIGANLEDKAKSYKFGVLSVETLNRTSSQIIKDMNNQISVMGDKMIANVFGNIISQYQKLGEGLLETATRVIIQKEVTLRSLKDIDIDTDAFKHNVEVATTELIQTGTKSVIVKAQYWWQQATTKLVPVYEEFTTMSTVMVDDTIAITQNLIDLAGGLSNFSDVTSQYYDSFFTEEEKNAKTREKLLEMFTVLNVEMPTSTAGFKELVESLDLTSLSGRELFTDLMGVSEAFITLNGTADENNRLIVEQTDRMNDFFKSIVEFVRQLRGDVMELSVDNAFATFNDSFNNMLEAISNNATNIGEVSAIAMKSANEYITSVATTATSARDLLFAKAMIATKFEGVLPVGFASGGYTGNMSTNSIAGVVHGQEYVVNAQTTRDLGLNNNGGVFASMAGELQSMKNLMVKLVADNDKQLHTQRALLSQGVA